MSNPCATLTSDPMTTLLDIRAPDILARIRRYSGVDVTRLGKIRSRDVRHPGNAIAVAILRDELEQLNEVPGEILRVRQCPVLFEQRNVHNIEAQITGRESSQVVIVSAHLDCIAHSTPEERATLAAPGADDDASGVAAVMALAECFVRTIRATGVLPLRTLRFVLFNAEEESLLGSTAYAREQREQGTQIAGVFQMDMIGFNRDPRGDWELHTGFRENPAIERRSKKLADLVAKVYAAVSPELPAPRTRGTEGISNDSAQGDSDHTSFHREGYPALVASEKFDFGPASLPKDTNPDIHGAADDFSKIDPDYAAAIARAIGAAAWTLANSRDGR